MTLAGAIDLEWQSSLVAGLALLLVIAGGRWLSSRARRAILWLALLKFVLPALPPLPALQLSNPLAAVAHLPRQIAEVLAAPSTPDLHSRRAILAAAWAAGAAAVLTVFLVRAWTQCRRLHARREPVSAVLQSRIDRAARAAGLRRAPPAYWIESEASPAAVGVLAPALLIPRGLDAVLDESELDAVLAHECCHLAARDNLRAAIQALVVSLHWFNPLVWWLTHRLQLETEMRCDEAVLRRQIPPQRYFSALAKAARHSLGLLPPGVAPAGATPLGIRLAHILAFQAVPSRGWYSGAAVAIALAAVLLSGLAGSITAATHADRLALGASSPVTALHPGAPALHPLRVHLVGPKEEGAEGTLDWIPARPVSQRLPSYPAELRERGVSGFAVVAFTVGSSGTVEEPSVVNTDDKRFGQAAVDAVALWLFEPAQKAGKKVESQQQVRLNFVTSTAAQEPGADPRPILVRLQSEGD